MAGVGVDLLHGPVLLPEGGDRDPAARGRPRGVALVRGLHPGRLPHWSTLHIPPSQLLQRLPELPGLYQQLPYVTVGYYGTVRVG